MQDHALTWYIKHSNDHPNAGITEIQVTLNREFSRPKSETQSIIRFKEIAMLLGPETEEYDSRSQHDFDGWAAPRMVGSITNTAFMDDTVTTKAFHPGRSLGDGNEIA